MIGNLLCCMDKGSMKEHTGQSQISQDILLENNEASKKAIVQEHYKSVLREYASLSV